MNPTSGNHRHFNDVVAGLCNVANTKIVVPPHQRLPSSCVYCACDCNRQVGVGIEGDSSSRSGEAKALGCMALGLMFGRLVGLGLAMGPAKGMLEAGRMRQRMVRVPVCARCHRMKGLPRIERVEGGLQIRCCEEFAEKYRRRDFGGSDPY